MTGSPSGAGAASQLPKFIVPFDYNKSIMDPISGGAFRATGGVSLREVTVDSTGNPTGAYTVLQTAQVNSSFDCTSGNSWGNDTVVFGDIGGNGHYCADPGVGALNLPPDIHYLQASYDGSGSGDNRFAPTLSPVLPYLITSQPLTLAGAIFTGNNQSTPVNTVFPDALTWSMEHPTW